MAQRFSRLAFAGLIAAATILSAEGPRCNVSARECDLQIRNMLSGKRYSGATVEEKKPGLVIKAVAEKSPAAKAGLRAGDRLVAVNGKSVTRSTAREFKQIVADARETGKVDMIVWRPGGYTRIFVKLEPYTKEQLDKIVAGHMASHETIAGAH